MGDSLPPPASFDLVGSFARRRGADVEIVLAKPEVTVDDSATVKLQKGRTTIEASAALAHGTDGDTKLTVRAPRSQLSDGTWSMTLRSTGDKLEPLAARLLVQGERPVVLLWGAKGNRSMVPPASRPDSPKRRAASLAGRALDRALDVLPEDKAVQARSKARTTARKILH